MWPAGRGITYERLERGGLQWPCPSEQHPGTPVLHSDTFAAGSRAPLQCVPFLPTVEQQSFDFPFLLTTGRTLYQFNAGTMTMRTANAELRATDLLDICAEDANRLNLHDRDRVRVHSAYGEAVLPIRITSSVKPGELFATFHNAETSLNYVTSPLRDRYVKTPEYKITAVQIEKTWPQESMKKGATKVLRRST